MFRGNVGFAKQDLCHHYHTASVSHSNKCIHYHFREPFLDDLAYLKMLTDINDSHDCSHVNDLSLAFPFNYWNI